MSLEIYQTVEVIKKTKNKKIELVKSEIDHLFYIKKTLYQGHFDIYTKLRLLALSGIVPIYEIHEENKSCILIEAYMNVPTLDVFIMNQELTSLQIQQIMEQLWQICSVLHSHGIVHRDIKPENIFYDGQRVTLFDFDIARFVQLHQNQDTQLLGSHGYAAPEQYGFGQSDARTDIYALGVLWNVMLTGQHPSCKLYSGYEGPMIQKAIHVDPMQRYQNVEAMRDDYHHQTDWTWVGFRHGSRMKKGIAGVLYALFFFLIITSPIEQVVQGSLLDIFYKIVVLGLLMIMIGFIGNYRQIDQKCIWHSSKYRVIRIIGQIMSCFLVLMIWILCFSLIYGIMETLHMF